VFTFQDLKAKIYNYMYQKKPFDTWQFGKICVLVIFFIQKLKSKHLGSLSQFLRYITWFKSQDLPFNGENVGLNKMSKFMGTCTEPCTIFQMSTVPLPVCQSYRYKVLYTEGGGAM
jgi:hypothetical protein